MSEYQIETRRRSRSKTPFLRSLCDHESCEHADGEPHSHPPQRKRAKTPNVRTIIEEEVTSSSSPHTSISAQKTSENSKAAMEQEQKTTTSDYSSDAISPLNKARKSLRSEFTEVVTTTAAATTLASTIVKSTTYSSSSTSSTRKFITAGGNLEGYNMATSTPKAQGNFGGQKSFTAHYSDSALEDESRQNQLNATQERVRKSLNNSQNNQNYSRENESNKATVFMTQSFNGSSRRNNLSTSNENIDPREHLPYMEYKNAGEYWNATPKTDYTYSELSPHRRELAPGVVAMPNMSRYSLGNYTSRVNNMIARNPEKEEWIRRLYRTDIYATERYDSSGDELDFRYDREQVKLSWWQRFLSIFITIWQSITSVFRRKPTDEQIYREQYYSKYYGRNAGRSEGFFRSISSVFLGVYSYFYSLALRTSEKDVHVVRGTSRHDNTPRKNRLWWLLIMLLPFLVWGGLHIYRNPNPNIPSEFLTHLTNMKMPSMQDIELPKIDLSDYFNEENYELLKADVENRWAGFSAWTNDYFLYLKTISQNIIDESRSQFSSN